MAEDSELTALRDGIRGVLAEEACSEKVHRFFDGDAAVGATLWATAAEMGWLALAVPEASDGLGLGAVETGVLFEELGRAVAPGAFLGTVIASRALAAAGTEAQQAAWLPRIALGELPASVGLEPSSVRAELEDGSVVLTGEASDLLDGGDARLLLVRAETASGPAWVLVEPAVDGVGVERMALWDASRHLGKVSFVGLALPADRLLQSADLAEIILAEAGLALAAEAMGGANAIFEATVEYLKTRQQFGKPIGSFQALKHRCADHKVALEASGALVREALALWVAGESGAATLASLAKSYACEVFAAVATDAVQLHGGIGFTWEHDCHLFLKRAKLDEALLGGAAGGLDRSARRLLAA